MAEGLVALSAPFPGALDYICSLRYHYVMVAKPLSRLKWTEAELSLLHQYYPTSIFRELRPLFPTKTENQLRYAAKALGLRKTEDTITRIRALGIKETANPWSAHELEALSRHYAIATRATLLRLLPKRQWTAIKGKAKQLGLHRAWTVREEYEHLTKLAREEKVWLAAALDFEGTIGISRHLAEYQAYISISNTNESLTRRFIELLRLHRVRGHLRVDKRFQNHKPLYQFTCSGMPLVATLLREIRPYLIAKAQQAELVLKFLEIQQGKPYQEKRLYPPEQVELYERLRALNARG